jgi:hypothetical protein
VIELATHAPDEHVDLKANEAFPMAAFKSILSDIANGLKKVFSIVVEGAQVAEPIIDAAFPGIAALYNLTVSEVANAEAAAIAAGQQSGTGPQKLALVLAALESAFNQYAAQAGFAPTAAILENYVNAVVASLNAIPATA